MRMIESERDLWGQLGEKLAMAYLRSVGYEIIQANYRCPSGEIDIVAREDSYLVFVEVRLKRSETFGSPLESVDRVKQSKLRKTAAHYIVHQCADYELMRFDVVGITCAEGCAPELVLVRDAFYRGQSV